MFDNMNVNVPLVSIICCTYNHEPYIRQCLDGFLMQKASFGFEVLIHDDASQDKTQEIIREYELKFPDIIKPIYQTENQYSKGVKINLTYQYPRVQGKYIALCEGDDYWTDPLKLQKQVDFMESNKDYAICGHRLLMYIEQESEYREYNTGINETYQLCDLIVRNVFCPTLSIVFRRDALDLKHYSSCRYSMDIVLSYLLLKKGKGFCLKDNMAVYRVHSAGVWSGTNDNNRIFTNIDVRLAIYELEQSVEAAMFLIEYVQTLGRKWLLSNPRLIIKAIRYVYCQFGFLTSLQFVKKIILK